ncbi:MAG: transglycosylase domain-containing protein [Bacteroidota bacterium]
MNISFVLFFKIYIWKPAQKMWRYIRIRKHPWYGKIIRILIYLILIPLIYISSVRSNLFGAFGYMPSTYELQHPKQEIASEIYSSDGHLLGKFFFKNRSIAEYDEIPEILIQTLIATEDASFYMHNGVDFKSMPLLLIEALKGNPRGGSTITQQLIKNQYNTRSQNHGIFGTIPYVGIFIIKTKEWMSALELESYYSKQEILVRYLNTVDFGSNAYGIKTAAQTFFNKQPQNLSKTECALLIGILNAPSAYSPIKNPKQARKRRNVILKIMLRDHIISHEEYQQFIEEPIQLDYRVENPYDGIANHFRQAALKEITPWLQEHNYNIYTDGLKIYTTLNYRMQKYAETTVINHIKNLQKIFNEHWHEELPWENKPNFIDNIIQRTSFYKDLQKKHSNQDSIDYYIHKKEPRTLFSWDGDIDTVCSLYEATSYLKKLLHAAFFVIDPHSGAVLAYVGGIDYNHFKYDNCLSKRQPGSTFKAFVYGAAIENGWNPCDSLQDSLYNLHYTENGIKKRWRPHNANWEYLNKKITLKHGFARSLNTITVRLTDSIGVTKIIDFAHKLGIKSQLDTLPSLCLGTSEVNLQELTASYTPFVNGGYTVSPHYVTHIEDNRGNICTRFTHVKQKVLDEETVFLMQQLFLGTLTEPHATTQTLFQYDIFAENSIDYGGKTGTSANYSDGWFIGVSPNLIAGTWVGAEERSVRFRTSQLGEGGKTALPIYGKFMEKVIQDTNFSYLKEKFPQSSPNINREYNCKTEYYPLDSTKTDTIPDSDMVIPSLEDISAIRD